MRELIRNGPKQLIATSLLRLSSKPCCDNMLNTAFSTGGFYAFVHKSYLQQRTIQISIDDIEIKVPKVRKEISRATATKYPLIALGAIALFKASPKRSNSCYHDCTCEAYPAVIFMNHLAAFLGKKAHPFFCQYHQQIKTEMV
ncbi:MAG: hypothetical protein ACTS73_08595 [Arsenophonus sp. NEOnobi-MAG3]